MKSNKEYPQRFGQSVEDVFDPTFFKRGNALSVDAVVDVVVVFLQFNNTVESMSNHTYIVYFHSTVLYMCTVLIQYCILYTLYRYLLCI